MFINRVTSTTHRDYEKQPEVKDKESVKIDTILEPVEQTVINSVAPARRIVGIPDMIKEGDVFAAAGIAGLTLVSLPEDLRDIKAAYNHSACALLKKRLPQAYNYRKYQHDFSFFRGTLLHELMKKVKSDKGKKIVSKIYNSDKTLYNTKFGTFVQKLLGIENGKSVKSKVKNLFGQEISVQEVVVKKDFLGLKDLTARTLKRTTVWGLGFMGVLELPRLIKAFKKGKDTQEKISLSSKQAAKSSINVLSLAAGMGYLGAIGAKKFGALGSLVGIGIGAIAGAGLSTGVHKLFGLKKKD